MAKENLEMIEMYFDYFENEYGNLLSVKLPLHQQILIVTFISALARGRYPKEPADKKRFVRLIEEYSQWSDSKLVSIPLLLDELEHARTLQADSVSDHFFNVVKSLAAQRPSGTTTNASDDPAPSALVNDVRTEKEKFLLGDAQHSSLLYHFRSRLVHEFRTPGYGMELSSDNTRPYYHWSQPIEEVARQELVYPREWLAALPRQILSGLKAYYLESDIDPYLGYDFGSHWRQRN